MQPLVALTGTPALAEIGEDNVVGDLELALARAREILGDVAPARAPAFASTA
jgi:hypothetical protein